MSARTSDGSLPPDLADSDPNLRDGPTRTEMHGDTGLLTPPVMRWVRGVQPLEAEQHEPPRGTDLSTEEDG